MTDKRRPDGTQPGDDRLMMVSPDFWQNWPVLTLKRRPTEVGKPMETALLYDRMHEGNEHEGEFRFLSGTLGFVSLKQLRDSPVTNVDKILEDGWVVD